MDFTILKHMPPWDWPSNADTQFLECLRNPQAEASDRLLAAELAGDYTVINDALAETLLAIVRSDDESDDMRGTAAIALGAALDHADTMGFEDPDDILISADVFHRLQHSLHERFLDANVPQDVRRKILEVSVRAPQVWHEEAVRAAYGSDDDKWRLTAVFCMRFIRGFDDLIVAALDSENPDIHYEAVCAAGNWEVDAAWVHVAALATAVHTDKDLLLAAIDALANIRPHEAIERLVELADSDDEDIADAAFEALGMIEGRAEYDDDDDEYF